MLFPNFGRQLTFKSEHTRLAAARGKIFMACLPDSGTKTILLVEDNAVVRKLVQLILEGDGFSVLSAGSTTDAMLAEVGFPGAIHLLICEVSMPNITGPDLATAMKKDGRICG